MRLHAPSNAHSGLTARVMMDFVDGTTAASALQDGGCDQFAHGISIANGGIHAAMCVTNLVRARQEFGYARSHTDREQLPQAEAHNKAGQRHMLLAFADSLTAGGFGLLAHTGTVAPALCVAGLGVVLANLAEVSKP